MYKTRYPIEVVLCPDGIFEVPNNIENCTTK